MGGLGLGLDRRSEWCRDCTAARTIRVGGWEGEGSVSKTRSGETSHTPRTQHTKQRKTGHAGGLFQGLSDSSVLGPVCA